MSHPGGEAMRRVTAVGSIVAVVLGLALSACFDGSGGSRVSGPERDGGAADTDCASAGTAHGEFSNRPDLAPTFEDQVISLSRAAGARVIDGRLTLIGAQPEDFEMLRCLEEVRGGLTIQDTATLTDLQFLKRLRRLDALVVANNPDLLSLNGLAQDFIDGGGNLRLEEVRLEGNAQLSDVDVLTHVDTSVLVLESNAITSLPAVVAPGFLTEVRLHDNQLSDLAGLRGVTVLNSLSVREHALTDLSDLEALTAAINLSIEGDAFTDLSGLSNLTRVDNHLGIGGKGMTSLRGLDSLQVLSGDLGLGELPKVVDLSGLEGLREVGGLHLRALGGLFGSGGPKNLHGLEGLLRVNGDVAIDNNRALVTLQGLDGLEHIEGELTVINNQRLQDLNGLEKLRKVSGDLVILANPELTSVQSLSPELEVRRLLVLDNPALQGSAANALATSLDRTCACNAAESEPCRCVAPCVCTREDGSQ